MGGMLAGAAAPRLRKKLGAGGAGSLLMLFLLSQWPLLGDHFPHQILWIDPGGERDRLDRTLDKICKCILIHLDEGYALGRAIELAEHILAQLVVSQLH